MESKFTSKITEEQAFNNGYEKAKKEIAKKIITELRIELQHSDCVEEWFVDELEERYIYYSNN